MDIIHLNDFIGDIENYAVLLLDKEGYINNCSRGAEKLFGYTTLELAGKSVDILYRDETKIHKLKALMTEANLNGTSSFTEREIRKDGTTFWGNVIILAVRNKTMAAAGFVKIVLDSTDLKANQEFHVSQDSYSRIIEEIQDYSIILLDKEGNIENWNRGAQKLKGYSTEEIIGKNFQIFYPDEDRSNQLPQTLLQEAKQNGRLTHEGWRVRKDGTRFWGYVVMTALHDENNEITGFIKVTRDLTDKMLAERAQQKYLLQLETRNRDMEQLAYITSHDLQEPLRTISSFIELLDTKYRPNGDAEGIMYMDIIKRSSQRMQNLIKGILDYSIIGTKSEIQTIDFNVLLEEVKGDLSASIQQYGATIVADRLPVLRGYSIELRQLFQNLLSNALKFSKHDKPSIIEINARQVEKEWLFSIKDNGIGMDNRFIHKIFMIFQRLNKRDEFPGIGLGLAYAKKIVELHEGRIWAESALGTGSTFYFTIQNL